MGRSAIPAAAVLVLALTIAPAPAAAQEMDPFAVPARSLSYSLFTHSGSDFDHIAGRGVRLHSDNLLIRFGDRRWGESDFGFAFAWEFTRPDYTGVVSRNRDLHRVQVPVMFRRPMSGWILEGYLAPGVATSSNVLSHLGRDGDHSDLAVSARIGATWSGGGDRTWRVGLASNRLLGGSRLYPWGGLELERGEWRWRLAVPDPSLARWLGGGHQVALRFYPAGGSWHVLSKLSDAESRYFIEGWRGELSWRWRWRRWLEFGAGLGYEFNRRHEFDDDTETRRQSDVDETAYARVDLRLLWGAESR